MNEYHEILGVTAESSPEEIRRAWRRLCLKHHPDVGGDEQEFLKITHAYKMLTDPSYARRQSKQPVKDLTFRVQLVVPFVDAFYGTKMVVSYNQITVDDDLNPLPTGDEIQPVTITFDLPAGSTQGFRYERKNRGLKYRNEIGKVLVQVNCQKHPKYSVQGLDVNTEIEVPLEHFLKGGEHVVDTLWGHRTIWIPPGTIPGSKIRVVGCGVEQRGHQYCTIKPIYPDEKELKQDKWKGLGINWQKAEDHNKQDEELFKKFEELKKSK